MFGFKNQFTIPSDPGIYIHRSGGPLNSNPGVGVEYGIYITKNWLNGFNTCVPLGVNPGKVKFILPKFINYVSSLTGPSPTLVTGVNADTLVWNITNFSNYNNIIWSNYFATFSLAISPTVTSGTPFTLQGIIQPLTDINTTNNISTQVRYCG